MKKRSVKRISVSLPSVVYDGLENLITERGYENRSLAVSDILRDEIVSQRRQNPDEVMAGSITLFYDELKPYLSEKISLILRTKIKEVVASLAVLLEKNMIMKVLVVQGPVRVLEDLLKELIALKGVETGNLTLTAAVLPPLHAKNEGVVL